MFGRKTDPVFTRAIMRDPKNMLGDKFDPNAKYSLLQLPLKEKFKVGYTVVIPEVETEDGTKFALLKKDSK